MAGIASMFVQNIAITMRDKFVPTARIEET
jgi:hypothetical protein